MPLLAVLLLLVDLLLLVVSLLLATSLPLAASPLPLAISLPPTVLSRLAALLLLPPSPKTGPKKPSKKPLSPPPLQAVNVKAKAITKIIPKSFLFNITCSFSYNLALHVSKEIAVATG
jgi:hypothetical protein